MTKHNDLIRERLRLRSESGDHLAGDALDVILSLDDTEAHLRGALSLSEKHYRNKVDEVAELKGHIHELESVLDCLPPITLTQVHQERPKVFTADPVLVEFALNGLKGAALIVEEADKEIRAGVELAQYFLLGLLPK